MRLAAIAVAVRSQAGKLGSISRCRGGADHRADLVSPVMTFEAHIFDSWLDFGPLNYTSRPELTAADNRSDLVRGGDHLGGLGARELAVGSLLLGRAHDARQVHAHAGGVVALRGGDRILDLDR
jgi:hypothetical protein